MPLDVVEPLGRLRAGHERRLAISLPEGLPLQEGKKIRELVAHLAPVDDHVDCTLLQQELGALEASGSSRARSAR